MSKPKNPITTADHHYRRKAWAVAAFLNYKINKNQLRKKNQRITQGHIADQCGLASTQLSEIKLLRRVMPDAIFIQFALGMDLNPTELLNGRLVNTQGHHLEHIPINHFAEPGKVPRVYKGRVSKKSVSTSVTPQPLNTGIFNPEWVVDYKPVIPPEPEPEPRPEPELKLDPTNVTYTVTIPTDTAAKLETIAQLIAMSGTQVIETALFNYIDRVLSYTALK